MSDTLRDQLLGLGFKPAPKPDKRPDAKEGGKGRPPPGKRSDAKPGGGKGRPADRDRGQRGQQGRGRDASRQGGQASGPARTREEIDLAKAYAIRAQREKEERIEAERLKQEEARLRREAREKLTRLLEGKSLNSEQADIARHFEYGGKIKRIYVTAEQLKALNAGELGVVQSAGRYQLVTAAVLSEAEALFAPAVALKVDPDVPAQDDPYADPKYRVPDDLIW